MFDSVIHPFCLFYFIGGEITRRGDETEGRETRTFASKRFLSARAQTTARSRGPTSVRPDDGQSRNRPAANERKGQQQLGDASNDVHVDDDDQRISTDERTTNVERIDKVTRDVSSSPIVLNFFSNLPILN